LLFVVHIVYSELNADVGVGMTPLRASRVWDRPA
jgi:hypothetical protein